MRGIFLAQRCNPRKRILFLAGSFCREIGKIIKKIIENNKPEKRRLNE